MDVDRKYVFRADWKDEASVPYDDAGLRRACLDRLPPGNGPWRNWVTRVDDDGHVHMVKDKGPYKRRRAAAKSWARILRDAAPGHRVHVESESTGPRYTSRAIKIRGTSSTAISMAEFALSMWGAPYVFGDLDCSGFTLRVVEFGTGMVLPHAARAQQEDPRVTLFSDNSKLERMDLVFMWFPNGRGIPQGQASHVGFWWKAGVMLDTRSPADPVGFSGIEQGSIVSFGRIEEVNGPLS